MDTFDNQIARLREELASIAYKIKHCEPPKSILEEWDEETKKEVGTNMELSYRHTEDARMRLGKVFQAMNNGESNSTK